MNNKRGRVSECVEIFIVGHSWNIEEGSRSLSE